jgi:VanZ family protein
MLIARQDTSHLALRWLAAATGLFWSALVLAMHVPMDSHPSDGGLPIDKFVHAGGYGVLGVLLALTLEAYGRAFAAPWWCSLRLRGVTILCVLFVYGCLDELTQPLTGRNCDPWDLAADMVGAIGAIAAVAIVAAIENRWLATPTVSAGDVR